MENQVVRRRMNIIAGHIAAHEDVSATATHILPMSCSNSLNSVIQRRDNGVYFARQAASSQACFMRQTTGELRRCFQSTIPSKSTISMNTRLYTSEPPMFSRPVRTENKLQNVGAEGPMFSRPVRTENNLQNVGAEGPMFSRPTRAESSLGNVGEIQPLLKHSNYPLPMAEAPCYARPTRTDPEFQSKKANSDSGPEGFEWSPKMDIAESGCTYVITIELPGISVSSIRVAVNNQKLMVTGSRSIQWGDSISAYYKKEILQGPYKVIWSLPTNADRDCISAEFVDGFLQIVVPKLSAVKKPLKAYI